MHYLVFIPNCRATELESVAKVAGLTHLFGGHDVLHQVPGPCDQAGLMIGWLSPQNTQMHYDPLRQDWVPSVAKDEHGKPRYWVGFWKDNPPRENELRRHYTQAGPWVQFGDLSESKTERWKLPTPATVDHKAVYNDDGTMRWEVLRKWSWVCDEAEQLKSQYLDNFGMRSIVFSVEPSVQFNWLLKLLQINYRMLPEVASYLEMWVREDDMMDVVLNTLGLTRKDKSDG